MIRRRRTAKQWRAIRRRRKAFLKFLVPITLLTMAGAGIFYFFKGRGIFKDYIESNIEKTIEIPESTSEYIEVNKTKKGTPKVLQEMVSEEIEEVSEEINEFPEEIEELPEIVEPEEIIGTDLLDMGYEFKTDINFEELLEESEDTVGWIRIDGTNVDHQIMQADDNEYYIHRDKFGNYDAKGCIYLDANNYPFEMPVADLDDLNFIYGHHQSKGKMFATICNYKEQDFYEEYPFFVIYTPDGYAYKADVFAGIIVSGLDVSIYNDDYNFSDQEEFDSYMEYLNEHNMLTSDISVEYGDKFVGLVTCTYENGSNGNLRFVVFARLSKQYTNELQIENGPHLGLHD